MEYVMVPVPEEIVAEVRAFLSWGIHQKTRPEGDLSVLPTVVANADEPTRALVRLVAFNTAAERRTTLREAAADVGVSTREVVGIAGELNSDVGQAGGPTFTIIGQVDPDPIEAGVKEYDHRVLVMTEAVASAIVDAADSP